MSQIPRIGAPNRNPGADSRAFARLFDDDTSCPTSEVAGFLRTERGNKGELCLGSFQGEGLKVYGTRESPLQRGCWYWVVARKVSPSVVELEIFLNKKGEFLGKAVFHIFGDGGVAGARVAISGAE